jgi:hypothetical protein
MSTRQTSIDVYNRIKNEGLLSKRRWQVYATLYNNESLTQNEVWKELNRFSAIAMHSISPRFAELKDRGVIVEAGERVCTVSGEKCIIWTTTDNLPVQPVRRVTSKQIIAQLEKENAELRARIVELSTQLKTNICDFTADHLEKIFTPERICSRCGTPPSGCIC